jgi:hypothetical protein
MTTDPAMQPRIREADPGSAPHGVFFAAPESALCSIAPDRVILTVATMDHCVG